MLSAAFMQTTLKELLTRSENDPSFVVPRQFSHPVEMREFLASASGVTAIVDRLLEFKPSSVPGLELWPAAEDDIFYPQEPDLLLRRELGIANGTKVVTYHGNVHAANAKDVRSLYLAIAAMAQHGQNIKLIRLGYDSVEIELKEWPNFKRSIIQIPFQPRHEIARYLALADVLIQPGRSDLFNDYRFPSKLPEFFAMGKPVILPASNVGLHTKPGSEALLLHRGDAIEIAAAMKRIFSDPKLALDLGRAGREFYTRSMSWQGSGEKLLKFYNKILGKTGLPGMTNDSDATSSRPIVDRYRTFKPSSPLSYATVMDFCDSHDNLNGLATLNQDLKDVQRPWVLKTILGGVPAGGRLLEIGAGDPWVADLLASIGYEVVVIDPYDGRDRGPDQFEIIKSRYPRVTFLRGLFPDALLGEDESKFDCIYSISVLEHLPHRLIADLFAQIAKHSRTSDSITVHAIDHVHSGAGAKSHLVNLSQIVRSLGFDEQELPRTLQQMDRDPETYFLSAEAHNRWRGTMPYNEFPMRRCISVQVCCPVSGILPNGAR